MRLPSLYREWGFSVCFIYCYFGLSSVFVTTHGFSPAVAGGLCSPAAVPRLPAVVASLAAERGR